MGPYSSLLEAIRLFDQMSPYLLFGFFFAGLLHIFVPLSWVAEHLGKGNFSSVVKSVILGIPLPLCSCGVIPAAITLRKRGASRGAVLSFLISTPITGVDSILATYALLGGVFTLFRIVAAAVIALVTGIIANLVYPNEEATITPNAVEPDCCHKEKSQNVGGAFLQKFQDLLHYAFVTLLGDIWRPLLVGLIIGGMISTWIPQNWIQSYLSNSWISMLIMMTIGIPMYVCATGSIPIAMALMIKGLTPGAALVFLLTGPATNAVTISVVARELGKKAVVIYLLTIAGMSLLMGWILNIIYQQPQFSTHAHTHATEMLPKVVHTVSSVLLGFLILNAIVIKYRNTRTRAH